MKEFSKALQLILSRRIDGFESLTSAKRLSGGASQETYRIEIVANGMQRTLAMRRASQTT